MAATTGYQAGDETTQTVITWVNEATWGTNPGSGFGTLRYTSETLSANKTRQRPQEIITTREAAQGITTQQAASGTINYALSYGTFDEFFACCMGADWGTALVIDATLADISVVNTATVITLTSTLSTKFNSVVQGQWLHLFGCTNAANNIWVYVQAKTSGQLLTVAGPGSTVMVNETSSGGNIHIRGQQLNNSTLFKSLTLQQQFSSGARYLVYAGAYPTRVTIQGGIGNFLSGAIDLTAKSEAKSTSNTAGSPAAAPSGRIIDPVAGFVGCTWNEAALGGSAAIDQFAITMENTGAAGEFGMGSAAAQGMLGGTFQCSGSFRAFFKTFNEYDNFQNEAGGRLAFVVKDFTGQAYAFTFKNAVLLGKVEVGGPNQPVYAQFDVEGGPASGGGSFSIDRMVIV